MDADALRRASRGSRGLTTWASVDHDDDAEGGGFEMLLSDVEAFEGG